MIVDARLRDGGAIETILGITIVPHILMSGDKLPVERGPVAELLKPFTYGNLVKAIEMASVGFV